MEPVYTALSVMKTNYTATVGLTDKEMSTISGGSALANSVTIKINGKSNAYKAIGVLKGNQAFRTQFDVTLDGRVQALSGGQALGSLQLTILDMQTDCSISSKDSAELVGSSKSSKREIVVTIPGARFKGIITSVSPIIQDIDGKGTMIQTTTIGANGLWYKK